MLRFINITISMQYAVKITPFKDKNPRQLSSNLFLIVFITIQSTIIITTVNSGLSGIGLSGKFD